SSCDLDLHNLVPGTLEHAYRRIQPAKNPRVTSGGFHGCASDPDTPITRVATNFDRSHKSRNQLFRLVNYPQEINIMQY
ncbi:hypothetical protein LH462_15580, partial [Laribacter hongkongensis]|uniref:hypothetical protein n=1 Tax=Laribacter hongkongensis TaxID=168471 RepID=UPI001EFCC3AA